jgi:hypothetical protein
VSLARIEIDVGQQGGGGGGRIAGGGGSFNAGLRPTAQVRACGGSGHGRVEIISASP